MGRPERVLIPERSALDRFGFELRRLRKERGYSLARLGGLVFASSDLLQKIEVAERRPGHELTALLDDVLKADGVLLRCWNGITAESKMHDNSAFHGQDALLSHGEDYEHGLFSLDPEDFSVLGDFTTDDEERLIMAARTPRRQDQGVVRALSAILAGQRQAEDLIGSSRLIRPVRAQLAVVRNLVNEARGDLRSEILDIGSQWSQFAGWLHEAVGHLDEAGQFYRTALELATEADKPDMVATALNMQGHTAWLRGNAGPLIGLSGAAQRDKRISPGVRVLAVQQEARGVALAGEARIDVIDCKFDEAESLIALASERPDKEPPWIYFLSPGYLNMQRGLAYRLSGHYAKAVKLLTEGLDAIPAEIRKSEYAANYLLQLASTYASAGDVHAALESASEASVIARQTGSARLHREVARFSARLAAKWPDEPGVIELAEAGSRAFPRDRAG